MLIFSFGFILGIIIIEFIRYVFEFHSFFRTPKRSWIGFDLDGTLAYGEEGRYHPAKIGQPVPKMVELVKKYIAEGRDVKIFTARVSGGGSIIRLIEVFRTRYHIRKWCKEHIGQSLPIVCVKDYRMHLLYDDRARQVTTDTGEIVT